MRESAAAAVGFLAASIFPAAVLSVMAPLNGELSISSAAVTFLAAYPFSAAFTFLFGIPTFLLLRRFGPGKWWSVLVVGFLLGALVSVVVRLPGRPNPHDILLDGPLAAGSALVFWLIWRRGKRSIEDDKRPER